MFEQEMKPAEVTCVPHDCWCLRIDESLGEGGVNGS